MKAIYIFTCSIFMLQLSAIPNGNDPVAQKPAYNSSSQNTMQKKTARSLATNETTTMSKINYYFVHSAVLLNGPIKKY